MSGTIAYSFDITFAGIALEVVSLQETVGRQVVQHRPSRGDGAQLSDRGQNPRTYIVQVQFTGDAEQVRTKRNTLIQLRNSGETRALQHPLDGIIRCKLEAFSSSYSAGAVTADMTLIEDVPFTERFERGALGISGTLQSVQIAAQDLDAAIPPLFATNPVLADNVPDGQIIATQAETWTSETQTEVVAQVEAFRVEASASQAELDATSNLDAYIASIALQAIRGAVERYAQVVQVIEPAVFELRVRSPIALIVLLAQLYGAQEGEELADEVVRTNDVRDATRVEAGTVLTLPRRAV